MQMPKKHLVVAIACFEPDLYPFHRFIFQYILFFRGDAEISNVIKLDVKGKMVTGATSRVRLQLLHFA